MSISVALGADDAVKPWSTNAHPAEVKRVSAEEITTGLHEYRVIQAGTMDVAGMAGPPWGAGWYVRGVGGKNCIAGKQHWCRRSGRFTRQLPLPWQAAFWGTT